MALGLYKAIASSTELPFFPYQLGDNSIPGELHHFIEKILELPNVQGMKLTTNQLLDISSIHNFAGDRLRLFSGSDELFCHAALCGCTGAIGSFYNLWGVACREVLTGFKNGNYLLARQFMLFFQKAIKEVLPNVWTFFRKAMLLKYGVDIGMAKAPLGNTNAEWEDAAVLSIIEKIEAQACLALNA
jgi:N-acetylneuraminate lyase